MKISHCYFSLDIGGVEQNLLRCLPKLLESPTADHELVLTHAGGELEAKLPAELDVVHLPRGQRFQKLYDLLRDTDLVHLYTINQNPLFRTTAFLRNLPIIDNVRNLLAVPQSRMASVITCASEAIARMQSTPGKIKVIPNGLQVDPDESPPVESFLDSDPGEPVLLEIGRAAKQREISAEQYVPRLKEKFPGLICHVLGREGKDQAGIVYHGEVTDPEPYYREANFLTHFPELEPFGMTVLEAYKHGVIPIVSGEGGIRDLVIDAETGFLLEEPTTEVVVEQLSVVLNKFTESPDFWEQMIRAGFELLKNNYTLEAHLKEYNQLYQQLAGENNGPQLQTPDSWSEEFAGFFEAYAFDKLTLTEHNLPHRKLSQPLERDLARLFSADQLLVQAPETASSLLNSLETKLKEDFWPWRLKCQLHAEQDEHEECIRCGRKAIELNSENAEIYLSVAHAYLRQNKPAEAVEILQDLTDRVPDYEPANEILRRLNKIL